MEHGAKSEKRGEKGKKYYIQASSHPFFHSSNVIHRMKFTDCYSAIQKEYIEKRKKAPDFPTGGLFLTETDSPGRQWGIFSTSYNRPFLPYSDLMAGECQLLA